MKPINPPISEEAKPAESTPTAAQEPKPVTGLPAAEEVKKVAREAEQMGVQTA